MEGSWDAGAAGPGKNQTLKPCLLRRNQSREQHGVAASCLEDLKSKGWHGGTRARAWGAASRAEGTRGRVRIGGGQGGARRGGFGFSKFL